MKRRALLALANLPCGVADGPQAVSHDAALGHHGLDDVLNRPFTG